MDDRRDRWTPMIEASHPTKTGAHDAYATALEMVGNRHSKTALVQLVCWLVQRVDDAEERLRTRGVVVGRLAHDANAELPEPIRPAGVEAHRG